MFWLKFIGDFFSALRAGETPGQIAGGFALGFLIGLMPFLTLQGLIFSFLLFLFNVNLGAGAIGVVIASFIAWAADPLLHRLGLFLLTDIAALQPFWTSLYNMPIAPLTRFNNSVALGSLIAGLVVVIPVYFLAKRFVLAYRDKLHERIQKWRVTRMVTGSSLYQWYSKVRRPERAMRIRKRAVALFAVVAILMTASYFLIKNTLLESWAEEYASEAVGARVEIDNLHLSLWNLRFSWDRLQVANPSNPWRNILETGPARVRVEGRPLFWGKFIISEIELLDVMSGAKRQTSGAIPGLVAESMLDPYLQGVGARLRERLDELPLLNFDALGKTFNVDSLVKVDELESVRSYNALAQSADSLQTRLETAFDRKRYQPTLDTLSKDINALRSKKPQNLIELTQALKQVVQVKTQFERLRTDFTSQKNVISTTYDSLQQQFGSLRRGLQQDIAQAKKLARLGDLDLRDISLILFGDPLITQFREYMSYVGMARDLLPKARDILASDTEITPPRFEGIDVPFAFQERYPRFLIRKIRLTGKTTGSDTSRAYSLSGTLNDLSTQPDVLGAPAKLAIEAAKNLGNKYNLNAIFDHRSKINRDSLWIKASNFAFGKLNLGKKVNLPSALIAKNGDLQLSSFFLDNQISADLQLKARQVAFEFADSVRSRVATIVRDVLQGVNVLDLNFLINGVRENLDMKARSNLDRALTGQLKDIMDRTVGDARAKVEQRVRSLVAGKRAVAEKQLANYRTQLLAKTDFIQKRVDEEKQRLQAFQDEIEQRIAAEKEKAKLAADAEKKKLQDRAKKALGGLLNRNKQEKSDSTKSKEQ